MSQVNGRACSEWYKLPRESMIHELESTCQCCGEPLKAFAEDVSEQLEYVPASFRVIKHVRPKYRCGCDDKIHQAEAPIPRSYAGPGLLSHVAIAKFMDHLPLYRQSMIYAREGVELSRSCLLYTSPSPRDATLSRMPSSA